MVFITALIAVCAAQVFSVERSVDPTHHSSIIENASAYLKRHGFENIRFVNGGRKGSEKSE